MTDRIAGFTVTLKEDVREDDGYIERVTTAIRMIAGVIDVSPIVADIDLHIAEERSLREWTDVFHELWMAARDEPPADIAAALKAFRKG